MLPIASAQFTPVIFTAQHRRGDLHLAVALAQQDMKKLIAYSSVAHMGFVTAAFSRRTCRASRAPSFKC